MKHTIFKKIRRLFKKDEAYELEVAREGRKERQNYEIKVYTTFRMEHGEKERVCTGRRSSKMVRFGKKILQFEGNKKIMIALNDNVTVVEDVVFVQGASKHTIYDKYGNKLLENILIQWLSKKIFSFEDDLMLFTGDVLYRFINKDNETIVRTYSERTGELKIGSYMAKNVDFAFFDFGRSFFYLNGEVIEYEKLETPWNNGKLPLVYVTNCGTKEVIITEFGKSITASSISLDEEIKLIMIKNFLRGYMDYAGRMVIEQEYLKFTPWVNGRTFGKNAKSEKYELLSKEGKKLGEYQNVFRNFAVHDTGIFKITLAQVKSLDGRTMYINLDGEEVAF